MLNSAVIKEAPKPDKIRFEALVEYKRNRVEEEMRRKAETVDSAVQNIHGLLTSDDPLDKWASKFISVKQRGIITRIMVNDYHNHYAAEVARAVATLFDEDELRVAVKYQHYAFMVYVAPRAEISDFRWWLHINSGIRYY